MQKNFEKLINSIVEGNISDTDLTYLKNELHKDPEKRRLFDEYIDIWQASLKARNSDDYNADAAWQKMKYKIRNITGHSGKSPTYQLVRRMRWIAAAVIIVVIGGTLVFGLIKKDRSPDKALALCEYIIPYGSRSQVILPDSTEIWLNSGSRIKYDGQFGQNNRNIFLEGEAYFDVTRNEKLPFVVNTEGLTIKVLGTAFNVKAYPEEDYIETTVERGLVQVTGITKNAAKTGRIVLKANQKLLYARNNELKNYQEHDGNKTVDGLSPSDNSKKTVLADNVSTKIYTSWKDKRWIIEREELQSLIVKLERRYNVNIVITDESLKHYVFSGVLEDETLEQVLEAIELTAPIIYKIEQKQVILSRNKYFKPN